MTPLERETVIIFNDKEPEAWITTNSKSVIKKLERKGYQFKELRPGCETFRTTGPKVKCIPNKINGKKRVPTRRFGGKMPNVGRNEEI